MLTSLIPVVKQFALHMSVQTRQKPFTCVILPLFKHVGPGPHGRVVVVTRSEVVVVVVDDSVEEVVDEVVELLVVELVVVDVDEVVELLVVELVVVDVDERVTKGRGVGLLVQV